MHHTSPQRRRSSHSVQISSVNATMHSSAPEPHSACSWSGVDSDNGFWPQSGQRSTRVRSSAAALAQALQQRQQLVLAGDHPTAAPPGQFLQ